MTESGGDDPSDPNAEKRLKKIWRWVRDLTHYAAELRQLREENKRIREHLDRIESTLDRHTGYMENLDRVIQYYAKEEVQKELDRRYGRGGGSA